jgi:hypothetical protein
MDNQCVGYCCMCHQCGGSMLGRVVVCGMACAWLCMAHCNVDSSASQLQAGLLLLLPR